MKYPIENNKEAKKLAKLIMKMSLSYSTDDLDLFSYSQNLKTYSKWLDEFYARGIKKHST